MDHENNEHTPSNYSEQNSNDEFCSKGTSIKFVFRVVSKILNTEIMAMIKITTKKVPAPMPNQFINNNMNTSGNNSPIFYGNNNRQTTGDNSPIGNAAPAEKKS